MPDQFHTFGSAIRRRFAEIAAEPLFTVDPDRDAIWERYLSAFPPGSNPIFRKRTEHDCSCCRGFVRNIGGVVALQNGAVATIWDLNGLPDAYQAVADAMAAYVRALPVRDIFRTKLNEFGQEVSRELIDGRAHEWSHFSADVPRQFITEKPAEVCGGARTTHAVLLRGFTELTPDAVATVADLIEQNALYRGEEHRPAVVEFQRLQSRFLALGDVPARELLAWTLISSPVARFRNTVIGTLVQDLSEGVDIERAVRSFEQKVAPQNYKRTTALITPSMVKAAMATIQELGLEPTLQRRHARFSDVDVNSVLFVDNAVAPRMKGGVEDLLMQEVRPAPVDLSRAREIGIDEFVASVIPRARAISLYLENKHTPNLVSLTAPAHADAPNLFRWPNGFAWSYEGNVADSIKERVKRAGGQVEGVALRISLAWHNTDDLDLHVWTPGGRRIFFGDKGYPSQPGGHLDVDMNVRNPIRDAVENIRWTEPPRAGIYRISVDNYTRRESVDVGFTVEVESAQGITTLRSEKSPSKSAFATVAEFSVAGGVVQQIKPGPSIAVGTATREVWGIKTQALARVNSIILSPNHWGGAVGNKHHFFILDGCANPDPTRGFYNEFLTPNLETHRKVFEILGDKTKCLPVQDQMSGVGFSSTRKDKVSVVATGPKLNEAFTIAF